MKQKTALIIAAGVTAFTLVAAGSVIAVATARAQDRRVSPTTQALTVPTNSADAAANPREAEYRKLIAEANARIQQLNAENAKLRGQLAQTQAQARGNTSDQDTHQDTYPVSAQQAAQIALTLAPGAQLVREPELVNFQGTTAYEVTLDLGSVYVDASSGNVLYAAANGQLPQFRERHDRWHDDPYEEHEQESGAEGGDF